MAVESRHEDAADVQAFNKAKITLIQAITSAENSTGGKVMSATFANSDGVNAYEIDVAKSDGAFAKVVVDAQTGALAEDKAQVQNDDEGDDNGDSEGEHNNWDGEDSSDEG
jgi:uncharacterized membrane protein YkoI